MSRKIKFTRSDVLGGKTSYFVYDPKGAFTGIVRFFDKRDLLLHGPNDIGPHWALLHSRGRVDRFETLAEAKDEAMKYCQ